MGCGTTDVDDKESGVHRPTIAKYLNSPMIHFSSKTMLESEAAWVLDIICEAKPGLQQLSQTSNSHSEEASPKLHEGLDKTSSESALPYESIKSAKGSRFIEVDPASTEVQASIQELWTAAGFGGLCANFFADPKNKELKLTLLVHATTSADDLQADDILGFLIYQIHRPKKYLSIRRMAIKTQFRGQGLGRQFIRWCIGRPGVSFLSATSVSGSVGFYHALKFRKANTWHDGGVVCPDDEPELHQVYMEYHPGSSKGGKNKKRK